MMFKSLDVLSSVVHAFHSGATTPHTQKPEAYGAATPDPGPRNRPRYKEIPVSQATAVQPTEPAPTTPPLSDAERDMLALAEAFGVNRTPLTSGS